MPDRPAAEVMCCPEGCKSAPCRSVFLLPAITNMQGAGYMIVPREPTKAMCDVKWAWTPAAIYRAMTAEGELK